MAYFPNGTAGEILDAQCADCPLGYGWNDPNQKRLFDVDEVARPCPVAAVQLIYNYDQIGNDNLRKAMSILIDNSGKCQVRQQLLAAKSDA
jgi:hypothetical protein